jgi:hypothetical protein
MSHEKQFGDHRKQHDLFGDPTEVKTPKPSIHVPILESERSAATPMADPTQTAALKPVCVDCRFEIVPGDHIIYGGLDYHRECTPWEQSPTDLKSNPSIDIHLTGIRIGDLAKIAEILEACPELASVHDAICKRITAHATYWVRCTNCRKVLLKNKAIFHGEATLKVKQETGMVIATRMGRVGSKVRECEVFCSKFCDTNYASRLKFKWQHAQEEKAEISAEKERKEPNTKKKDILTELLKLSKKDPRLEKELNAIIATLQSE